MAKECSFDVVSVVDMQEVDNAFQQAKKELAQRYDLKDSGSSLALDKAQGLFTVQAPSDFVARQVIDIVQSKCVKRGIDLSAISWSAPMNASGGTVKITGTIISGIDKDKASTISKDIRKAFPKVKAQIEGDKLRVISTSKDALQDVIAFLKGQDYGQPLQFVNYR